MITVFILLAIALGLGQRIYDEKDYYSRSAKERGIV